jgi:hypothetical protein
VIVAILLAAVALVAAAAAAWYRRRWISTRALLVTAGIRHAEAEGLLARRVAALQEHIDVVLSEVDRILSMPADLDKVELGAWDRIVAGIGDIDTGGTDA